MLVSIIITNYNYGPYLAEAIDSALAQTHPETEVIVVDDGSSDGSREIIESYGDRLLPIYRQRGGQCAASNAGYAVSRGDVVIFLDADDMLLPKAAEMHIGHLERLRAVKSCGYMEVIGANGRSTGRRAPQYLPRSGNYLDVTLARGLDVLEVSYTSAHAWTREFLEQVMPLPEHGHLGVDGYLTAIDRLFGPVAFIHRPVVRYRRHQVNKGPARFSFDPAHLTKHLERKRARVAYAESWMRKLGLQANLHEFRRLRDWRLALMQHVLMLWGHDHQSPPFLEFVASPFQPHRPSVITSLGVCLGLAAVRVAPRPLALALARALLMQTQSRRATSVESELLAGQSGRLQSG